MTIDHDFTPMLAVIDGGESRVCGIKVDGEICMKRKEAHEQKTVITDPLLADMARMQAEPLHPNLAPWVEEGEWGPMLRHPLVYSLPLVNGFANRVYEQKRALIAEAETEDDWTSIVWMHERPHRLTAFINYCTGREDDEDGTPIPLVNTPEHWELAAAVWVDSENINQCLADWRALICEPGEYPTGLWLGDRDEFDALDWDEDDTVLAYRGGAVGDWSWTTSLKIAEFFSRLSGHPVRSARIPRADCFGYLTRRQEYELLVRLTPEREALVYPDGFPETEE